MNRGERDTMVHVTCRKKKSKDLLTGSKLLAQCGYRLK